MDVRQINKLLNDVKSGRLSVSKALEALKHLPYEDISFAKVDHHRSLRSGIPEVIYAEGKADDEVIQIATRIHKRSGRVLITRASEDIYNKIDMKDALYYPSSGTITIGKKMRGKGLILVVSAGTSDRAVAEEAEITAAFLGSNIKSLTDVGVAGIHRLLNNRKEIDRAKVVVVVAGMEGALPSVVGGLTDKPIIAVPTSVGYGTSLGGLTALFAMLNSCVPGIGVVNIDNGFGAACLAHKINTQ
ncbi:MAG: nickel pincer cofactor biosynthesis protein LarB [Nitrospirota bacterium]|nr:MAG: nickel pincer cofactor biosynthesis protein LarB [Nitrospirota bacterium]